MAKPSVTRVEPNAVPELKALIEAQHDYEEVKKKHSEAIKDLETAAEAFNQKLEAAYKVCQQKHMSGGPLDLYQFQINYDAKALFDAVGRERFLQIGGTVETKAVYDVDRARIEASIDRGLITSDTIEVFRKVIPKFHKPNKVVI